MAVLPMAARLFFVLGIHVGSLPDGVNSGVLKTDDLIYNVDKDIEEKIGKIYVACLRSHPNADRPSRKGASACFRNRSHIS